MAEDIKQSPEICDSCNKVRELFDVPHHQTENKKVWKYCATCKDAHEKEVTTVENLKQLRNTHPADANKPEVAGMFNEGKTLDEVKRHLDTNKQPSLEAEVQP